jgi:hypothetical protein
VLAAGGGSYFDVANVHYYSSQEPTWVANGRDVAGKVNALRQVMARRGLSKPVAVTELGWTSSPKDAPDLPERQARYVPKVFARGLAAEVYAMTWFSLADWQGADYPYGLVGLDRQPRPAYRAFQVAADELGRADSVRPLTAGEANPRLVEGYAYRVGQEERWVLWAVDEGQPTELLFPARSGRARDKLGDPVLPRRRGRDVALAVGDSPVYVHWLGRAFGAE